ncbi:MAG: phosphoribosylglycinamide formyltransferase [Spirochaetaceae bacterium]|nr:phosphoribosylglycinamide formyltransferase [Spirochaetaceae bacterium]MDT8298296.1 phosphoribosylglycinamide formyltransferase [Spirochaetaceae bacterium]
MVRLAVLVSGGGTNLQSILDSASAGHLGSASPVLVAADRNCGGIDRADRAGIESVVLDRRVLKRNLSTELQSVLDAHGIDMVALAGWLSILDREFTRVWDGRIINIHPSLLPRHGGPGMYGERVHKAVLESGDHWSGCSVHFVTEEVDGGEILGQERVKVLTEDTPETLAARILPKEHILYPRMIAELAAKLAKRSIDG